MNTNIKKKARVLFLAWGESIHARRRIQTFVEDSSFEVAVASTFNYDFAPARNYLLGDAKSKAVETPNGGDAQPTSISNRLKQRIKKFLVRFAIVGLLHTIWKAYLDLRTLRRAVFEFKPEVVFLQTLLYPCYLALFLPRSLPQVITFWNGDVTWWAKRDGIERLAKKQIVTWGVRRAQAVTVNSVIAREACLNYGISADKIHLIRYPGVDLSRFQPGGMEKAKRQLGLRPGPVVFCPRGLGDYLNSDVIVEAASLLVRSHPDVLFLMIWGEWAENDVRQHQKRVQELGLERNFRWQPLVPWDEMPLFYEASDVVVSISSLDSLPNCMLEAMACAKPLVMGDIPAIRDWIKDGWNGLLVSPRDPKEVADAIRTYLVDSENFTATFVERNLELVMREFDSRKNCGLVKDVVRNAAFKAVNI